jgi:two-component system phosphate regulon sensor histidine kinase PhoR
LSAARGFGGGMRRRSLLWKLYFTYSLVIVFCMALIGGYLLQRQRRIDRAQTQADLAQMARVLDERFGPAMDFARAAAADSLAKAIGLGIGTRITVIAPDGRVLADTSVDPRRMENHRFRPEVQAALEGDVGHDARTSASDFAPHLYVAIPSAARPGWVMRVAIPLEAYQRRLRETTSILAGGGLVAAAVALVLGFVFTRRITRPVDSMRRGLERLERGEFGVRLDPESDDEIGQLARTLNRVQERLEVIIGSLTSQRNEREAILGSMVEGVIAVDGDDRVLLVNAAAQQVLGIGTDAAHGRPLLEVARFPQLSQFVAQVRASTQPLGVELVVRDPRPRYLELHGAPLRIAAHGPAGAVVVFNDVTRLRKLEEVRREFVANVSHELKTPITSIKGFLETLLDGGALEDPEASRRFLGIVARQSDRLAAIIEDLLYLSRLEYEERQIAQHPVDLRAVIERSVANFEHEARGRGIRIAVEIEARHRWTMGDSSLLSRAVDNLIDNAIKYSHQGGRVEVTLREGGDELHLSVRDHGIGIADEHLSRVSERFYRVDTARSREMGGTGLGLAIVKHVARVHAGTLHIQSEVGLGSCFTIRLPRPAVDVWPPPDAGRAVS